LKKILISDLIPKFNTGPGSGSSHANNSGSQGSGHKKLATVHYHECTAEGYSQILKLFRMKEKDSR
jgi:hypothetical protein